MLHPGWSFTMRFRTGPKLRDALVLQEADVGFFSAPSHLHCRRNAQPAGPVCVVPKGLLLLVQSATGVLRGARSGRFAPH